MKTKIVLAALSFYSVLCGEMNGKASTLSSSIINFETLTHQSVGLPEEDIFKQQVAQEEIVVVKFSSDNCSVCRTFMPIFSEVAEQHSVILIGDDSKKVAYVHVDIDLFDALSDVWGVQFLPTTIFFKNGEQQRVVVGMQSKEVLLCNIIEIASMHKELHKS